MKIKILYVCETCSFESTDIEAVLSCERKEHFKPDKQFETITKEIIESFRPRLEALRARDKKLAIDSGPVALYHALYTLYCRGFKTTLQAALTEVEKLYNPIGCSNCYTCLDRPELVFANPTLTQMILCSTCGNKRCPKATNHINNCTKSNEPGQQGSIF